jgi:hypothetical protein
MPVAGSCSFSPNLIASHRRKTPPDPVGRCWTFHHYGGRCGESGFSGEKLRLFKIEDDRLNITTEATASLVAQGRMVVADVVFVREHPNAKPET